MSERQYPIYELDLVPDLLPEFGIKEGDRITIERKDGTTVAGTVHNIAGITEIPWDRPYPPPQTIIQLAVDTVTSSRIR